MTDRLSPDEIAALRNLERTLLGERPARTVAEAAIPAAVMQPGVRPRRPGDLGWCTFEPVGAPGPSYVAEAGSTWPKDFPNPRDAIRKRFEPRELRLKLRVDDPSAAVLVRSAFRAGKSIQEIVETLGLPLWFVRLVIRLIP